MPSKDNFQNSVKGLHQLLAILLIGFVVIIGLLFYIINDASKLTTHSQSESSEYVAVPEDLIDPELIENGIHVRTGFVEGKGLMLVIQNCTNCHSAKLVTQNRMSKEKWLATIRWMQETQNLWDLGANEDPILEYLSTYYAPDQMGRRANLEAIEWYDLD